MQQTSWLDELEASRGSYLEEAREVARKILVNKPYVTIDDVRELLPPPEGVDPRVMGAVFKHAEFESVGWVASKRKINHKRPIQRFRLRIPNRMRKSVKEYGDVA